MALWNRKKTEVVEERTGSGYAIPPRAQFTFAGANVSETTALGLPAFWRATNMLADSVARLPLHSWKAGKRVGLTPSILLRPNALETKYETMFNIMVSLILRGNAYIVPFDFDNNGYPRQIFVINPDAVQVCKDKGVTTYKIGLETETVILEKSEVVHIKGYSSPGCLTGLGVIEAQKEALSQGLAMQEYASRYFTESAVPPMVIEVDGNLEPEDAKILQDGWVAAHGRSRVPAILTNGMKATPLAVTPEESQFLESRQFSIVEIANMVGIPSHFIGGTTDSMTYSNVELDTLNFVQWFLTPWLIRIEQAFSDLLPRGSEARFNIDALLRSTTLDRYAAHKIAIEAGFLTIDEVRELEGREPLEETPTPEEVDVLVDEEDEGEAE